MMSEHLQLNKMQTDYVDMQISIYVSTKQKKVNEA